MASLPAVIFQFAMSPYDDWHSLAWAGALLVTATVLTLSIIARLLETETELIHGRRDIAASMPLTKRPRSISAICPSTTAPPRR